MAKFEIYRGNNGEFYFRLKAGNGEVILSSEGYKAKASAENGVKSVKENAPNDDRYDRKEAKNGKFYFNLLARNGQIIGTSQMYASKQGMENGIDSVKRNAPSADVVYLD